MAHACRLSNKRYAKSIEMVMHENPSFQNFTLNKKTAKTTVSYCTYNMIHLGWLKWFNLKPSEKCYLSFVWPWAYTVCREHISVTLCLVGLMHKAPTKQSQHFSASYHSVHQILHALGHPDEMCCNTLVLLAQITVSINKQILILLGQNPFILYSQPIRCHI